MAAPYTSPSGQRRYDFPIESRRRSISSSQATLPSQDDPAVKRPLNSFMLYRKDKQHHVDSNNHQSISKIIGEMWRNETAEVKLFYDRLAQSERRKHQELYPGYKFQPKKKPNPRHRTLNALRAQPAQSESRDLEDELAYRPLRSANEGLVKGTQEELPNQSDNNLRPIASSEAYSRVVTPSMEYIAGAGDQDIARDARFAHYSQHVFVDDANGCLVYQLPQAQFDLNTTMHYEHVDNRAIFGAGEPTEMGAQIGWLSQEDEPLGQNRGTIVPNDRHLNHVQSEPAEIAMPLLHQTWSPSQSAAADAFLVSGNYPNEVLYTVWDPAMWLPSDLLTGMPDMVRLGDEGQWMINNVPGSY
ncbi:hypothetical protein PYCC9005_002137 [Savitreella phatthalungensis]